MPASAKLKEFIKLQLNHLYCSSSHLIERFSEIADEPDFSTLKAVLNKAISEMEQLTGSLDKIYEALNIQYHFDDCDDLITALESSFFAVQQNQEDATVKDLMLLDYVLKVESGQSSVIQLLLLATKQTLNFQFSGLISALTEKDFAAVSLKFLLTDRLSKIRLIHS